MLVYILKVLRQKNVKASFKLQSYRYLNIHSNMFKNQDFIVVTAQSKIKIRENYSNGIYRISVLLFSSTNQKCHKMVLPDVIKDKNVIHVKHCLLLLLREI